MEATIIVELNYRKKKFKALRMHPRLFAYLSSHLTLNVKLIIELN